MRQERRTVATAVTVTILLCSLTWIVPVTSVAKSPTPIEGVRLDAGVSLKDNLKALAGKDVYVHLRSGKTLQGYVKSVGDHLVYLEKLAGRDFFDALVRIEDISAIETKCRDMK